MISPVSSTESVVCVMYATFASAGRSRASASATSWTRIVESGRLSHRPDHFLVPGVADQDHRVPVGCVAARLDVHLRDERARGVDHVVVQLGGVRVHGGGDPVRREHDGRALREPPRPRRRSRPRARGRARRARCGRSACARRRAARAGRAACRRCRRPAQPRRNSRAARPEDPLHHQSQCRPRVLGRLPASRRSGMRLVSVRDGLHELRPREQRRRKVL